MFKVFIFFFFLYVECVLEQQINTKNKEEIQNSIYLEYSSSNLFISNANQSCKPIDIIFKSDYWFFNLCRCAWTASLLARKS